MDRDLLSSIANLTLWPPYTPSPAGSEPDLALQGKEFVYLITHFVSHCTNEFINIAGTYHFY